jgi:hypothetical protein
MHIREAIINSTSITIIGRPKPFTIINGTKIQVKKIAPKDGVMGFEFHPDCKPMQ